MGVETVPLPFLQAGKHVHAQTDAAIKPFLRVPESVTQNASAHLEAALELTNSLSQGPRHLCLDPWS